MSKIRIKKVNPISLGKVSAIITFFLTLLVMIPLGIMFSFGATELLDANDRPTLYGISTMLIVAPFMYSIFAFIGGTIGALIYNSLFRFHNGIEVEIEGDGNEISQIGI